MKEKGKKIQFNCTPSRCVFDGADFKVYGTNVDGFAYPDIKLNKYGNATICGNFHDLTIGSEYIVTAYEKLDKYGHKYEVVNIRQPKPMNPEASRRFLAEILTSQQASELIREYPDIIDRVMDDRVDDIDLKNVKGIKEKTFAKIKVKIIENFKLAELVDDYNGVFSIAILKKLYTKYASVDKLRHELRTDPYKCLCGLSRIGFKTADAMLLGIDEASRKLVAEGKPPIINFQSELKTSYQRMKACAIHVLEDNESNTGSTRMKIQTFKQQCESLTPEAKEHLVDVVKNDSSVHFDAESLYISTTVAYMTELFIAEKINEGLANKTVWDIDYAQYDTVDGFALTDDQKQTVRLLCNNNILLLDGVAGSGKSFSVQSVIKMLQDNKKSFTIMAPTGRASKVITEFTGQPSTTIHRGLGYNPVKDEWFYGPYNPLGEDVVIVDEFSMVDIHIAKRLLSAIDFTTTKLLIIGDSCQLPSVGAGNVLHDILHSGKMPKVTLTKVFRYGIGGISTAATDTRNCKTYLGVDGRSSQVFGDDKSYVFMPAHPDRTIDIVVKSYKMMFEKGYSIDDIVVLSAYNKGDFGTVTINNKIQAAVNKNGDSYTYGDSTYKLGDPVIQCVNNYKAPTVTDITDEEIYLDVTEETDVFVSNGEIGKVVGVYSKSIVVDFGGVYVYYKGENFSQIKLGYAISTHKSQGSGFKVVILVTPKAHRFMLNSNLLYVGITRAKEKCIHIGDLSTINAVVKKKENFSRDTFLSKMLS